MDVMNKFLVGANASVPPTIVIQRRPMRVAFSFTTSQETKRCNG